MPRAYSNDLRRKFLQAYDEGGGTLEELAEQFRVSLGLMAHRGEPRYYAFDLLWLNGTDLRPMPLLDRSRMLRRLIPANDSHLLYL
jgi:ATP-dependent DNA ligase